jgi:translation elongation factor EF-4
VRPSFSVLLLKKERFADEVERTAFLGDTFHLTAHPTEPLESFKPLKSMVFAGIYPLDPGGFGRLEEAIRRVRLPFLASLFAPSFFSSLSLLFESAMNPSIRN